MPTSLKDGRYIDSIFISKDGLTIYFIHAIYPPNVLNGSSTPAQCTSKTVSQLNGHVSLPGVEWNTDIYYSRWENASWSEPVNLEAPVNSLGMECCVWLNANETELIFYRDTDLDGDGSDGDLGTTATGNYRTVRNSKSDLWGTPVALPGLYGTDSQSSTVYRHDIQKSPSGNLYLWQKDASGDRLLYFGEKSGGTYNSPTYASPVQIPGSVNEDTQLWVNDSELQLFYNHRISGQTEMYRMSRSLISDPWGTPAFIPTNGFTDTQGNKIWGEPTFDQTESFMIFIRFNTADPSCYLPDIMWVKGDTLNGFSNPIKLN